jgi:hypothetical protein
MNIYNVEIKETLVRTVEVKAKSLEHAEELVTEQWNDSKHVLDSSDFRSVSFEAELMKKEKTHER